MIKVFGCLLSLLFFVHCGIKEVELQCGCEDRNRRQYLVTASVSSSGGLSDSSRLFDELKRIQEEERDIYGLCVESSGRDTFVFCTEKRNSYRIVEDLFPDINFRDEDVE